MNKRGQKTRNHIKACAGSLFAEKGFKQVTMKDICEAAHISRGGLYCHYESTRQIFQELLYDMTGRQDDDIDRQISQNQPAAAILDHILEIYRREMPDSRSSLSMAIYEYFSLPDIADQPNALYQQYLLSAAAWKKLIRYGIDRQEFYEVDIDAVFDLIACAAGLEEIIAYGAEKIIQFGCCGILDQSLVGNKIILPSSAVRDEGTSYHYLSGSEEINADSSSMDIAIQCLKHHKIPYITGKVWTTDAIYRETPAVIRERKAQGCIAVEMECSASLAVARFRNIPIIQFFYGADSLDGDTWDMRDLTDYGMCQKDTYMAIALECAIAWVS